jgi:hypothetical protein
VFHEDCSIDLRHRVDIAGWFILFNKIEGPIYLLCERGSDYLQTLDNGMCMGGFSGCKWS